MRNSCLQSVQSVCTCGGQPLTGIDNEFFPDAPYARFGTACSRRVGGERADSKFGISSCGFSKVRTTLDLAPQGR